MKRDIRIAVMLSEQELTDLQEYRWRNRISSQNEAVRRLVAQGVKNEKADAAATASTSPGA